MKFEYQSDSELQSKINALLAFRKVVLRRAIILKLLLMLVTVNGLIKVFFSYKKAGLFTSKSFPDMIFENGMSIYLLFIVFLATLILTIVFIPRKFFLSKKNKNLLHHHVKNEIFQYVIEKIHAAALYRPIFKRHISYFTRCNMFSNTITEVIEEDCVEVETEISQTYYSECTMLHGMKELFHGIFISIKIHNETANSTQFQEQFNISKVIEAYKNKNNYNFGYKASQSDSYLFIALPSKSNFLDLNIEREKNIIPSIYENIDSVNLISELLDYIDDCVKKVFLETTILKSEIKEVESEVQRTFSLNDPGSYTVKALSFFVFFVGIGYLFSGEIIIALLIFALVTMCFKYYTKTTYDFSKNEIVKNYSYFFFKTSTTKKMNPVFEIIIQDKTRRIGMNSVIYEYIFSFKDSKGVITKITTLHNKKEYEKLARELELKTGASVSIL